MRSVFVHLRQTTEQEVVAFLDRVYPCKNASTWLLDNAGDPVLYIDFYRDMNSEFEVEAYFALLECLDGVPDVSLIADVSGRHAGDTQVRSFVCTVLSTFSGVAQDEYTERCWSCEEIQQNVLVPGHLFFDYMGWHTEE